MSKRQESNADFNPQELEDQLIGIFNQNRKKEFSEKDIIIALGVSKNKEQEAVYELLDELTTRQRILKLRNGRYKAGQALGVQVTGRIDFVNARFGYCISPEKQFEGDVWISARHMLDALDGDTVRVMIYEDTLNRKGKNPEGEVVEVIARGRERYVGKIELKRQFAFLRPDNRKMHVDIVIAPNGLNGAIHGQKAIVKITNYGNKDKNPEGVVEEILGMAGDNNTEMHAILAEFDLPNHFPAEVEQDAELIPGEITPEEIARRRDFRSITTCTIDPHDAKDFDDALSLRKLDNGNWEVGVHIADVTHYVKLHTRLEEEAYDRATSVYLVDRTIPMLPERLSNGLCSLRPHEDKLTFSAVFELDEEGKIHSEWFGKTIIHSDRRFSYEEVQEILEGKEGDYTVELHTMNRLAYKLREDRFRKGAITFETIEVKFRLDENGKPLEVIPKVRKDAHKMIEDFMLLANRKVAEYIHGQKSGKDRLTFVYRIHDYPDPDKLGSLVAFAQRFGHKLEMENEKKVAKELNRLTQEVEGKPEQNVLQSLAIRCMAKAKYTTEPEIHFGLAYKNYTHFTSPIRRYPDMMVHRLLEHYLNKGQSANRNEYEEKCVHSSEMEKRAAEAERASIKYKQVEFMSTYGDGVLEGIISGVTEFGMFVEIVETKCEGLVRMADLEDDFYEADTDNYRIIGKRNKKMFTLGDKVKVRIKRTDLERRTIDLSLEIEK